MTTAIRRNKERDNRLRWRKIKPVSHDEWLAEREHGIGASDAGAVLGVSQYSTPYRVWRRKVGIDEPVKENWAMQQGHIFERVIAEKFKEDMGYDVIGLNSIENRAGKLDWLAVDREKPFLRVSPDWLFWSGEKHNEQNKRILECKTSRVNYTPDCLTNECLSWWVQVQYQMYVLGHDYAYLGFLCVETGDHWFEMIPYNKEYTEGTIIPALEAFWRDNILPAREVEGKECKEQFAPALIDSDDTLCKYPKEQAGKSIEIDNDLADSISAYSNLSRQKKDTEKQIEEVAERIKMQMGDAESITGEDGKPCVTWKANKDSLKFDAKRFEKDHPDLFKEYCEVKPGVRVFKVK